MLGWDALNSETLPLFHFEELDAEAMHRQLLNSMPKELFSLASEEPVTIDTMRHMFANRTAARFSDLDSVVLELSEKKEIEILRPDGTVRSRALRRVKLHRPDYISHTAIAAGNFTSTLTLFV